MTERELIRRLENSPVPPPPEDLAARIIKDIPAEIELHPEFEHEEHRRRFHRRPVWMAAAAAVTIALTGAVTWELRNEGPSVEMVEGKALRREAVDQPDGIEEYVDSQDDRIDRPMDEELSLAAVTDEDPGMKTPGVPLRARELKVKKVDARTFPLPDQSLGEPLPEDLGRQVRAQGFGGERHEIPSTGSPGDMAAMRNQVPPGDPTPELNNKGFAKDVIEVEGSMPIVDARGVSVMAGEKAAGSGHKAEEKELYYEVQRLDKGSMDRFREMARGRMGTVGDAESPAPSPKKSKIAAFAPPPSTGGRAEPNDQPYGDVFFEHTGVNPFVDTEDDRLSTFGLDVDTGSFTVARRYLRDGNLPPRAAIRVEEFINAFDYGDRSPRKENFRLIVEGAPSVFADSARTYTLRLAVKAREVDAEARPPAVLVFCVDVSGSMDRENRLGLVKKALYELLENLRRDDHVGLVVYGSTGRVLLKPTTDHEAIRRAIERLSAGGSTNAEEGLVLAYDLLSDGDADGRIRRVILCSDGVANVGRTGPDSILERIRREAADGIELTTVGFGMGNYNDVLMERLADSGDGRYAYVDDFKEARRIFVEELTGTLLTLGHDAKAQVEFDPDVVSRWRLLGYENRDIADHLFRDPSVDAGEIGAGHTVTALYEVKLRSKVGRRDRVATLHLRYRPMGESGEVELEKTLKVSELERRWNDASPALKLASIVAEFAEILKGAYWAKDGDLDDLVRRVGDLRDGVFEGRARVRDLEAMVVRAAELHHQPSDRAID